jgi:hypothetical protein
LAFWQLEWSRWAGRQCVTSGSARGRRYDSSGLLTGAGDTVAKAARSGLNGGARRTKSLDALLPVLYLRGVSAGDFQEALAALLGKDAPASPIIPSCSARSRRASSTWRLSMPPSPMKAGVPHPMASSRKHLRTRGCAGRVETAPGCPPALVAVVAGAQGSNGQ